MQVKVGVVQAMVVVVQAMVVVVQAMVGVVQAVVVVVQAMVGVRVMVSSSGTRRRLCGFQDKRVLTSRLVSCQESRYPGLAPRHVFI